MEESKLIYSKHHAFSALANPLPLPKSSVDEFNFYYYLAEQRRNISNYSDRISHLQSLLRKIFLDLDSSITKEDNLRLFLNELRLHASQLLNRDLQERLLYPERYLPICAPNQISMQSQIWATQMLSNLSFNGTISASLLNKLKSLADPTIEEFRNNYQSGKMKREDLSANGGEVVSQIVNLINSEFDKIGVNHAVSIYCSRPMRVGGLALELSAANAQWWEDGYGCYKQSPKTLYMHTDESISVPKAIVYLTDVSEDSGAFSTVPNALDIIGPSPLQLLLGRIISCVGRSSDSKLYGYYQHRYHQAFGCPKFREHFMALPQQLQYNSHFGWDIIPESTLEKELLSQESIYIGKAGCYKVFDGARLVHRGGLVKSGERIALQVCFNPVILPTFRQKVTGKAKSLVRKFISQ